MTNDVEFLLDLLCKYFGGSRQKILEVACGGGRICIPIAKAGHMVTGFDIDNHMLLHCYRKMKGMNNISCYCADALISDWGSGFDVVVLGGNILLNIETNMNYAQAQQSLIDKAALALRPGGFLFLDLDLHFDPAQVFNKVGKGYHFKGTDDIGTWGRTVNYGSVYDPVTNMCVGTGHWEIRTNTGESFIISKRWHKHIPSQKQVYGWLDQAGFTIERSFKNYSDKSIPEPIDESTHRAVIWAKKACKQ